MAWPPASLPTNRTNGTPQNNTHPADHNAISQAINDTVGQLVTVSNNVARSVTTALGSPSIAAGATQSIAWSSLSTSAWGAGPTLVAPAGTTGTHAVMANVGPTPTMGPTDFGAVQLTIGTQTYKMPLVPGAAGVVLTAVSDITTGDQVGVVVYNPTGSAGFFTVRLVIAKVGA